MKFTIEISDEQLTNILESAVSSYWGTIKDHPDSEDIIAGNAHITLIDSEDDGKIYTFGNTDLENGIRIISEKYPHLMGQIFDSAQTDMYTGDFIIQCGIFGELKYS